MREAGHRFITNSKSTPSKLTFLHFIANYFADDDSGKRQASDDVGWTVQNSPGQKPVTATSSHTQHSFPFGWIPAFPLCAEYLLAKSIFMFVDRIKCRCVDTLSASGGTGRIIRRPRQLFHIISRPLSTVVERLLFISLQNGFELTTHESN